MKLLNGFAEDDAVTVDAVSYETIVGHIPSKNTVVLQEVKLKLRALSSYNQV